MAASIVTVKNLGDPRTESEIRKRLEAALKQCAGWRVTVFGSSENDDWEIKGENPTEQRSWKVMLVLPEHQTAEFVVHIVKAQIISGI